MPRSSWIRPPRSHRARRALSLPMLAALVALASSLAAAPSDAHEYWLAPSQYRVPARQAIDLSALAGTGFRGEKKPFTALHCVRFLARTTRVLELTPIARDGEYTWARFAPADSGGALF